MQWKSSDGARRDAVAQAATGAPLVLEMESLEIDEWTIHIVDRYRDMKVVAVIEVASPANKARTRTAFLPAQAARTPGQCLSSRRD